MTAILQITVTGADPARVESAVAWLRDEVPHPPGFVSFRVLRDAGDPLRTVFLEEWDSEECFRESLRTYGPSGTAEFLDRMGLERSAYVTTLWLATDTEDVLPLTHVQART